MGKVIEKIKNFFKCRIKKPAQPAGKEEPKAQQEGPKAEEKPEEQK